jgi:hypothetical protein
MKKNRGDEPIGVIIHTYMEIAQGNSLCSYLYLRQAKMSCVSFYLFSFSFYKIGEQKGRTGPEGDSGGSWYQWKGEVAWKGVGGRIQCKK